MASAAEHWDAAADLAAACLQHPFVQGMADGSLPAQKYRYFIAQDAFFLEAFARGYAHCLSRAPDREGIDAFKQLLDGVFEELVLHQSVAAREGIDLQAVRPSPACLAYTRFLTAPEALAGTLGECMAAMTPCMRLYAFLGQQLAAAQVETPTDTPYQEWIDTYRGGETESLAALLEALLDRYGDASEAEAQRYQQAMILERDFFSAAWEAAD